MSNMDKKQEAFFTLARGLASAIDCASQVGSVLIDLEEKAEDVRKGTHGVGVFTCAEFGQLLSSMSDCQAKAVLEIGKVLEIIVRNAEASGVIDSEFAKEFIGKFSHTLSKLDEGEDKPEGFGGRFSAN